ncbi:M10 family metallopeptidase [Microvirga sp. 2MCAF38]|uniref:M10 family metallopeptidase n=1 Tax=Microvirga sp. 2MCAF38 TaxID=3232989 RepID=UPI003F9A28C1
MTSRLIPLSNDPSIDGLLSGVAWGGNTLIFSFPTSASVYDSDGNIANGITYGNETNSFQEANIDQKNTLSYALGLIETYTNLSFLAPNETTTFSGAIRFALTTSWSTAAGYYPEGFFASGDIWMNSGQINPTYQTPAPGNWGFATILHEVGHTMGLKHGHDQRAYGSSPLNPGPLPAGQNNWNYSLMTYSSYEGAATNPVQGNTGSDNPQTYMQDDIAALQHMYGANFDYMNGPTLYQWDTDGNVFVNGNQWLITGVNAKVFMTLWDGGGEDTIDLFNFQTDVTLDLRPGAFSTFNTAQRADLDKSVTSNIPALGNFALARLYQNDPRSLIENGYGGKGNDKITGNAAANILVGYTGNDTLEGGANNDLLDGMEGTDIAVFSGAFGNYRIVTNADGTVTVTDGRQNADGQDILKDIQLLQFSDRTVSLPLTTTPTTPTTPVPTSPILRGTAGADSFSGTDIDEQIFGYNGKDTLSGGLGNDSLFGGAGNDLLTGGGGRDGFIFDTRLAKTNVDRIVDFKAKEDRILIDDKFFKGVGKGSLSKPVKLSKDKFYVGSEAKDANDRIVYNKAKGFLSYDPDGNGDQAAIKFAVVKAKMSLSAADIWII